MNKIEKFKENPLLPFAKIWEGCTNFIPSDKLFLSVSYLLRFHKCINWSCPVTFNEKLQWLKVYDHNEKYTKMVDKYEVREIVGDRVKMFPLLGVWEKVEDIDFESLPNKFVLKPNHDSGSVEICKDKTSWDRSAACKRLQKALDTNYFFKGREWPYKNVKRRIIAEKYMESFDVEEIYDYKFMCFNGRVEMSFVVHNRFKKGGVYVDFYDREWNKMPFTRHYPTAETEIPKPLNYERMIELSEHFSTGIPFLRVDFYEVEGELYFGEFTFYPGGGLEPFQPAEWDEKIGELLKLET